MDFWKIVVLSIAFNALDYYVKSCRMDQERKEGRRSRYDYSDHRFFKIF